jgi:predicted nucleotidyltransferase
MEFNVPQKYRHDIENIANLLKKEGCREVYLFGSLVTGKANDKSDIDIGIKGFEKKDFFRIYSKLYFNTELKIDLVDFDNNNDFFSLLTKLGEVVQIG